MESVIEKIKKLQAKAQSASDLGNLDEANAFARAFLDGAVIGIENQLKEQRKKHVVEYSTLPIILTNNEADLRAYINVQWPRLKTKAAPNYGSIEGKILGIEVGKSISISSGVNLSSSKQNLLGT